jgi:hypothetical protein
MCYISEVLGQRRDIEFVVGTHLGHTTKVAKVVTTESVGRRIFV